MPKRVYKFTSAFYGLSNLRSGKLKLSTIDDLNDPFDLTSIDTTDLAIDEALESYVRRMRGSIGILCFSRNWDNILLWSHYGASHTGICLGFDVPDDYDVDVHYQPNLIQIRGPQDVNEELQLRMLRTKHENWSYEQEVRLIVKINDPPDEKGLWWYDFGPQLELKEVIAGAQCAKNDLSDLADALKRYGDVIERSCAYMRKDAFLLVRHPFSPPWFR
jgi:hypothetical protein